VKRPKSVVIVSDVHVPYNCHRATKAFLDFVGDVKPDQIVLNGDILDMHAASSHGDAGTDSLIMDELEAGSEFLDRIRVASPRSKVHFNEGNHEQRLTRYVAKNAPNLRGMTTVPSALSLAKRRITWLPYGKVHFVSDKLGVTHGTHHGTHYARDTLVKYGMSLVVGHAHRPQIHTMGVAGDGADSVRGVFGLGCLVPVDTVPYINGPSGWTNGFGLFYVMPDGTFTPYIINMAKQKFAWGGKVYG